MSLMSLFSTPMSYRKNGHTHLMDVKFLISAKRLIRVEHDFPRECSSVAFDVNRAGTLSTLNCYNKH